MKNSIQILMVEDNSNDELLVTRALRKSGLNVRSARVETREAFITQLQQVPPDIILLDHGLPSFDGFAALELARSMAPEVPLIFVTGALGEEMVLKTLKQGATDYILKHHLGDLGPAVHRALEHAEERARRRYAEDALRESEERYRNLVEMSPDAVMVVREGEVVFLNPAAVWTLGASCPGELIGRSIEELVHPDSLPLLRERMTQVEHSQESLSKFLEHTFARADGEPVLVEAAVNRMFLHGEPAVQFIFHDITERKSIEKEVQRWNALLEERVAERTSQLAAVNRELEAFSFTVSHDLRAPLRHIQGFSEILRSSLKSGDREATEQALTTITKAAAKMDRLIEDLLAFSRMSRGGFRDQHVAMRELIETARSELAPDVQGRNIEWRIGDLPEIRGDREMLKQVVINLLSNAVKYSRPRAHAIIEAGYRKGKVEHLFYVRDNGVGFDPGEADKLFGVFKRLHSAHEFEGTGIGLAIVRRIIARHGGRCWAEGKPQEGATFFFTLPRNPKATPILNSA